MSVRAPDAVARPVIKLAAAPARAKLPTIAGGKDDIDVILHHHADYVVKGMAARLNVLGVRAKLRLLRDAVEDRPRIDENPRARPTRELPQESDQEEHLQINPMRCIGKDRNIADA